MMRSENDDSAPAPPLKLLILAGTAEARALAARLAQTPPLSQEPRIAALASLAGVTPSPAPYACPVRTGGFGGAAGLAAFLRAEGIGAVIDATHPFATRISANAAAAAAETATPILRLERPPWTRRAGEEWIAAPTIEAAAAIPPSGARVFLATGPGAAPAFAPRRDLWIALRALAPAGPFPLAQGEWVIGAPGSTVAAERALFERLDIGWLVTKNSGGARRKLDAAREIGLRIVMIDRPAAAGVPTVTDVEEAAAWARGLSGQEGLPGQESLPGQGGLSPSPRRPPGRGL